MSARNAELEARNAEVIDSGEITVIVRDVNARLGRSNEDRSVTVAHLKNWVDEEGLTIQFNAFVPDLYTGVRGSYGCSWLRDGNTLKVRLHDRRADHGPTKKGKGKNILVAHMKEYAGEVLLELTAYRPGKSTKAPRGSDSSTNSLARALAIKERELREKRQEATGAAPTQDTATQAPSSSSLRVTFIPCFAVSKAGAIRKHFLVALPNDAGDLCLVLRGTPRHGTRPVVQLRANSASDIEVTSKVSRPNARHKRSGWFISSVRVYEARHDAEGNLSVPDEAPEGYVLIGRFAVSKKVWDFEVKFWEQQNKGYRLATASEVDAWLAQNSS